MKVSYISKTTTKLLNEKESYPKGANSPTLIKTYECFCKKGKIIEERVIGFNDHFAYFKCRTCSRKYSYLEFSGNDWAAYEKD